ncbi:MAG: DUF438 domain-containing protein [Candidatus Bathyarchaeia archaeon]
MSINREKIEILKNVLRELHRGLPMEELKRKFKDVLEGISPFEIPLVEQELIKEGVQISEILRLCDLHVELLRDVLRSGELRDVPRGHPLDLLSRENERISRLSEALNIYAGALSGASPDESANYLKAISDIVGELRRFRAHYRKIQMLIFPYLERRGITAVPRVLWGREDQAMVKLRELSALVEKGLSDPGGYAKNVAEKAAEISREISDLIFREERILFPSVWVLLSEGEWAAIHDAAKGIGYSMPVDVEWMPKSKPILPYEVRGAVTPEQVEKLPQEFKFAALAALAPDAYEVKSEGDLEFDTGFLSKDEVEAIFKHLPIEMTYADANDRVTFFSEGVSRRGFARTKTIIGRRLEYCHPPRLENFVKNVVNELKSGKADFREYWTRLGDRIIRVIVAAVKDKDGNYLGTLEMVEDLTEIVNNPEEVKRRIVIL